MSKYKLLMIISSYFVLMVLLANSIEGISATEYIVVGPGNIGFTSGGIFGWIGTFLRLTFFQVEGVPLVVNLPFTILVLPLVYMALEIVKDIIPF